MDKLRESSSRVSADKPAPDSYGKLVAHIHKAPMVGARKAIRHGAFLPSRRGACSPFDDLEE